MNFQLDSIESEVEEDHDSPEAIYLSQNYDLLTENHFTSKVDLARRSYSVANLPAFVNNAALHTLI